MVRGERKAQVGNTKVRNLNVSRGFRTYQVQWVALTVRSPTGRKRSGTIDSVLKWLGKVSGVGDPEPEPERAPKHQPPPDTSAPSTGADVEVAPPANGRVSDALDVSAPVLPPIVLDELVTASAPRQRKASLSTRSSRRSVCRRSRRRPCSRRHCRMQRRRRGRCAARSTRGA